MSDNNVISGMTIEFDNSVKSKLTSPKFTKFDTLINLNLNGISLDGKKGGAVNNNLRDYVTHIFGSYTGKFECMGFKTSNGKFYMSGNVRKGTPFIIGKYGEKFHGMKIGLKDGINMIKPSFKKGWFMSPVPKDDSTYQEDELIDDEVQIQNLTGAELEYALYYFDEDENMFPFFEAQDNPRGESYDEVVYGVKQDSAPFSSFFTQTDFTSVKRRVANIVKPPKNQKQIQEEEKKRLDMLSAQAEEFNKQKKEKDEQIKKQLGKPVNIADIIPKDKPIYFAQSIPKNSGFDDKHLPNDRKALFGKYSVNNLPKDVDPDEVDGWDRLTFSRANELFETENFQVFLGKIEPGDILQGSLGNCYFLSAIATIAEEAPDMIKARFLSSSKSNEGIYGVFTRVTGVWKTVLVDDYFPTNTSSGKNEFAFTRANGPELWVVLLEKVWSKLCGSYINIIGGMPSEVFNTFTNSYTETINLKRVAEEALWIKLLEGENCNFLMSAGTGQIGGDKGLTPGHAYSLLRAKEVLDHGVKTRIVELRNPWGEGEWSGEWSDNSDKWTMQLKEECKVSTAEDGKFWMNLKDFMTYYEICNICKIHKDFYTTDLNLNKSHTQQHLVSLLQVPADSLCYIQIHQKYRRFILKDGSYPTQVIFNMWLLDDKFNYIESIWSEENIECIHLNLKKGQYYILTDINYRLLPDVKPHGYSISCYSQQKCKLEIAKNLNGEEVLKKALISYARIKLKPLVPNELKDLKREDAVCFKKTVNNPFPGHIYVFENKTSDLTFDGTVRLKDNVNAGVYDFESKNIDLDNKTLNIEVKPNSIEVVYIRFIRQDTKISYIEEKTATGEYCNMSLRETDQMLEKLTFEKGQKNEIDPGCGIFEFTLQHKKGFGIGFENRSQKKYRLNVLWDLRNLAYTAQRGNSNVETILEPGKKFWGYLAIINPDKQSAYDEELGFEII
jgi:calpain-15